jgi:hypothetical protein
MRRHELRMDNGNKSARICRGKSTTRDALHAAGAKGGETARRWVARVAVGARKSMSYLASLASLN